MKKLFFSAFAILTSLVFTGCDDGGDNMIWDFNNYDVVVFLKSSDGKNLLDRDTEGNIVGNEITVEYGGETYRLNEPRTRDNLARWQGLRIENYYGYRGDDGTPALMFGEFKTSTEGHRGEKFTIDWGDGTKSEITFDLYLTWTRNRDKGYDTPTTHRKIWLDGELQSEYSLTTVITK